MTKEELEKTEWAIEYKKCGSPSYYIALRYASQTPLFVNIYRTDESGEMVWAIQVDGDTFWMDAKKTKKEAINLCKKMGWKIIE